MIPKWVLFSFAILFVMSVSPAYAQHHSGALAPPIDFEGLQVALSTILSPEDFTYEDEKNANLSVRFFDSETDTNIQSVTYRIQIFHEDVLVANEYFFDEDGKLDLKIKPTTGCQEKEPWKCTEYYGEKHAIAGAYYARGDSLPTIQGPVFDKSGQYNVKVSIVGATNPKTMTTTDLLFETFLHLPQREIFLVKTANAEEFPISIKSYNGEISNFAYDESLKKISYEIPHQSGNIDSHPYNHPSNKQIISIKEGFSTFQQGYDVEILVNGKAIQESSFRVDGSVPGENIIRVEIPHEEWDSIKDKESDAGPIKMEILSGEKTELSQLDFVFENGFTAKATWDSKLQTGKDIPITFSFFDQSNAEAKNILFAYSITDKDGNEVFSNIGATETYLGILATHGIVQESVWIPSDEQYTLKLILTGQNSKNFEKFLVSESKFSISSQNDSSKKLDSSVPTWIKSNAGWWADGTLDDDSFFQGIQFLIKEGFMTVSSTEQSPVSQDDEIPSWIKSNAGWWADDLISDADFLRGIEFLISNGIIAVN